tara:strand:+ start:28 stop:1176 length:1149 start_codon:yes stop_codon:yes gene_type:complete
MINKNIIGIDASNILAGGGLTHLSEILSISDPAKHRFDKIVIWGSRPTLNNIEDKSWIIKKNVKQLNGNLFKRLVWQVFKLNKAAINENCTILFIPGGIFLNRFFPAVLMCQNLLPFEKQELIRYFPSIIFLRLVLLRFLQSISFKRANGMIFLSEYAQKQVNKVSNIKGMTTTVAHGIHERFQMLPKQQKNICKYNKDKPFRIIYVSIIDEYKHQWHVVEAISMLKEKGIPIALDLIGPANKTALKKLNKKIEQLDVDNLWVNYHGPVPFKELHLYLKEAHLGLFASSCENLPNILIETMAAGLPMASSNRGPMPEILKNYGIYFDPEDPKSISDAVLYLINSPEERERLSKLSFKESQTYSWNKCADKTFNFINKVKEQS